MLDCDLYAGYSVVIRTGVWDRAIECDIAGGVRFPLNTWHKFKLTGRPVMYIKLIEATHGSSAMS